MKSELHLFVLNIAKTFQTVFTIMFLFNPDIKTSFKINFVLPVHTPACTKKSSSHLRQVVDEEQDKQFAPQTK